MRTAITPAIGAILLTIGLVLWKVDAQQRWPRVYVVHVMLGALGLAASPLTVALSDNVSGLKVPYLGIGVGYLAATVAVLVLVIHFMNNTITTRTVWAAAAMPICVPFLGGTSGAAISGALSGIGNAIGAAIGPLLGLG
jgi:hypothetical protein